MTAQPYAPQPGQKVIEGQFRTANGSPSPSAPSAQEEFNPDKGGRWDLNNPTPSKPWDPKIPNLEGKLPSGHGVGVTQYPHREKKGTPKNVERVPPTGKESRWKSRFMQEEEKKRGLGGKVKGAARKVGRGAKEGMKEVGHWGAVLGEGLSLSNDNETELIKSIDYYLTKR